MNLFEKARSRYPTLTDRYFRLRMEEIDERVEEPKAEDTTASYNFTTISAYNRP